MKGMSVLAAPSQAPIKVMWNTSNSKIILNWEQVKALENESEVTGYKVRIQRLNWPSAVEGSLVNGVKR